MEFVITGWAWFLVKWVVIPVNLLYFGYACARVFLASASDAWEIWYDYVGILIMSAIIHLIVLVPTFAITLLIDWIRS